MVEECVAALPRTIAHRIAAAAVRTLLRCGLFDPAVKAVPQFVRQAVVFKARISPTTPLPLAGGTGAAGTVLPPRRACRRARGRPGAFSRLSAGQNAAICRSNGAPLCAAGRGHAAAQAGPAGGLPGLAAAPWRAPQGRGAAAHPGGPAHANAGAGGAAWPAADRAERRCACCPCGGTGGAGLRAWAAF